MTQAQLRFTNFDDYLTYSATLEGCYELIDGELVELPPESGPNDLIANRLMFKLVIAGIAPLGEYHPIIL